MSIIDRIREQQSWEQPKKSSGFAGFVAGTVAAFAAGIILVMAWGALPVPNLFGGAGAAKVAETAPAALEKKPAVAIAANPARLGSAAESALLRTCVPTRKLGLPENVRNKDIYRILQVGAHATSVASLVGAQQNGFDPAAFADLWADVADCVYRQNGWVFCQPDNRALAVEAVGNFVRQTGMAEVPQSDKSEFSKVAKKLNGDRGRERAYVMQNARAVRERVLAALKTRVEEGRLVASDFGFFTPGEVMAVVKSAKPREDACAAR